MTTSCCLTYFNVVLPSLFNDDNNYPAWLKGRVRHVKYHDFSLTPLNDISLLQYAAPYVMAASSNGVSANQVRLQVEFYYTMYDMVKRLMREPHHAYFCHLSGDCQTEDFQSPENSHAQSNADITFSKSTFVFFPSFLITSRGVERLLPHLPRIMSTTMWDVFETAFGKSETYAAQLLTHHKLAISPKLECVSSLTDTTFSNIEFSADVILLVGAAMPTVVEIILRFIAASMPTPLIVVCEPVSSRHDNIAKTILFGEHPKVILRRYAIASRRYDNECKHLFVATGKTSRLGLPVHSLAPYFADTQPVPVITRSVAGVLSEIGSFTFPLVVVCAPDVCESLLDGTPSTALVMHVTGTHTGRSCSKLATA